MPTPVLFQDITEGDWLALYNAFDGHSRGDQPEGLIASTGPPWVIARALDQRSRALRTDPTLLASVVAVHVGRDGQGWLVRAYLARTRTAPALTRIAIESFPDPGAEVTGVTLRAIPVATIRDRALPFLRAAPIAAQLRAALGWSALVPSSTEVQRLREAAEQAARKPKRGRKGYGSDFYRQLAYECLEAQRSSDVKNVNEWLAQRRHVTAKTIQDQLWKAAKLGFLTGGQRGRRYIEGPNLYRKEVD